MKVRFKKFRLMMHILSVSVLSSSSILAQLGNGVPSAPKSLSVSVGSTPAPAQNTNKPLPPQSFSVNPGGFGASTPPGSPVKVNNNPAFAPPPPRLSVDVASNAPSNEYYKLLGQFSKGQRIVVQKDSNGNLIPVDPNMRWQSTNTCGTSKGLGLNPRFMDNSNASAYSIVCDDPNGCRHVVMSPSVCNSEILGTHRAVGNLDVGAVLPANQTKSFQFQNLENGVMKISGMQNCKYLSLKQQYSYTTLSSLTLLLPGFKVNVTCKNSSCAGVRFDANSPVCELRGTYSLALPTYMPADPLKNATYSLRKGDAIYAKLVRTIANPTTGTAPLNYFMIIQETDMVNGTLIGLYSSNIEQNAQKTYRFICDEDAGCTIKNNHNFPRYNRGNTALINTYAYVGKFKLGVL